MARAQTETYVLVEKYESPQHDGGPEQPHQMKTQMEVACVSGRGLDRKEEKDARAKWKWT